MISDVTSAVIGAVIFLILIFVGWITYEITTAILDAWWRRKTAILLRSFDLKMAIKDSEIEYKKSLADSLCDNRVNIDIALARIDAIEEAIAPKKGR